jgi:hypothetical protein
MSQLFFCKRNILFALPWPVKLYIMAFTLTHGETVSHIAVTDVVIHVHSLQLKRPQ